jgi:hypothetical protein
MPNWNSNDVAIHAPFEAVKAYLVPQADNTYRFNMHLLFPEQFTAADPTGETDWDEQWAIDRTGSEWCTAINIDSVDGDHPVTWLRYDTSRTPNNELLRRLHELTGWRIGNEFECPDEGFEGTYTCHKGVCTDEPRDYLPRCQVCDLKKPARQYTLDPEGCVCNKCWNTDRIS